MTSAPPPASTPSLSAARAPRLPAPAVWLGAAGLLPFLVALLLALIAPTAAQRAVGVQAFVAYGATILSFLGGVRWGAALPAPDWRRLSMAVMPGLIAFLLLLIESLHALRFLAMMFLVVGLFDWARGTQALWPGWYKTLRMRLTVAVLALHLLLIGYLP